MYLITLKSQDSAGWKLFHKKGGWGAYNQFDIGAA